MHANITAALIDWIPMVVLIVIWIAFSLRMRRPQDQSLHSLQQQVEVSERIAQALEEIVFLLGRQKQR